MANRTKQFSINDFSGGLLQDFRGIDITSRPNILKYSPSCRNVISRPRGSISKFFGYSSFTSLSSGHFIFIYSFTNKEGMVLILGITNTGSLLLHNGGSGFDEANPLMTGLNTSGMYTATLLDTGSSIVCLIFNSSQQIISSNGDSSGTSFITNTPNISGETYPQYGGVYKGRVFCSLGSTVYYTTYQSETEWDTANSFYNLLDDQGSEITGFKTFRDNLYVSKNYGAMYIISHAIPTELNESAFTIEKLSDEGGWLTGQAVVETTLSTLEYIGSNDFMRLENYPLNAGREFTKGYFSERIPTAKLDRDRTKNMFSLHDSQENLSYFFFYNNENDFVGIVHDYLNESGGWFPIDGFEFTSGTIYIANNVRKMMVADTGGGVHLFDQGNSRGGEGFLSEWNSFDFLIEIPVTYKKALQMTAIADDKDYCFKIDYNYADQYGQEYKVYTRELGLLGDSLWDDLVWDEDYWDGIPIAFNVEVVPLNEDIEDDSLNEGVALHTHGNWRIYSGQEQNMSLSALILEYEETGRGARARGQTQKIEPIIT